MSEITDKVSFGRREHHLHPCLQIKQVDKVSCLRTQAGGNKPT